MSEATKEILIDVTITSVTVIAAGVVLWPLLAAVFGCFTW